MMKKSRLLLISALMCLVSVLEFAGISVLAEDVALSDWTFAEKYAETFDSINAATLKNNGWTLSRDDVFTQRTSAGSFEWNRWVQYNNTSDGVYYYKYKVQMFNPTAETQLVKLIGANEYNVIAAAGTYDVTTVVDNVNKKAFTFDHTGALIKETDFTGDTITGIKFMNTLNVKDNNGYWIYDVSYGEEVNGGTQPEEPAEPEAPAFDDWILTQSYAETFDSIDATALKDALWSLERDAVFTQRPSAGSFEWNRWVQYNNASDGVYYYKYKIQMYNPTAETQFVKLIGANEYTVISAPGTYDVTTVVDSKNAKAYTYDYDGTLISMADFENDTIVGIKFMNTENTNQNNGFWVYDFSYGTGENKITEPEDPESVEIPAFGTWKLDESYAEGFDYDESIDAKAIRAELLEKGWSMTSRDDALTKRNSAVSFYWNRFLQYTGSTDGVFYYTYKIRMYNDTEDSQLVKLVTTAGEQVVLASPTAYGSTYEFTTVVDTVNEKAYTYDYHGTPVSVVDLTGTTVTGIKFQNMVNSGTNNDFWVYDFYFGTVSKKAYAGVSFSEETTEVSVYVPEEIVLDEDAVMYVAFYSAEGDFVGVYKVEDIKESDSFATKADSAYAKAFIWNSMMIPLA